MFGVCECACARTREEERSDRKEENTVIGARAYFSCERQFCRGGGGLAASDTQDFVRSRRALRREGEEKETQKGEKNKVLSTPFP